MTILYLVQEFYVNYIEEVQILLYIMQGIIII